MVNIPLCEGRAVPGRSFRKHLNKTKVTKCESPKFFWRPLGEIWLKVQTAALAVGSAAVLASVEGGDAACLESGFYSIKIKNLK